jgi:hypothetical protein
MPSCFASRVSQIRLTAGFRYLALGSVARYFGTRNPGIPGIIHKLERPGMRNLAKARAFWDTILSVQPLKCIYSSEPIQPGYDLDHFLLELCHPRFDLEPYAHSRCRQSCKIRCCSEPRSVSINSRRPSITQLCWS